MMKHHLPRFACCWALALAVLVGCESSPPVSNSDPAASKRLLETALETWKTGGSVADLKAKTPPLYVADEQWERGFRLQDFKLQDDGQSHGTNVRFQVVLIGSDAKGKKSQQTAIYLVTNTPAQTIARESL